MRATVAEPAPVSRDKSTVQSISPVLALATFSYELDLARAPVLLPASQLCSLAAPCCLRHSSVPASTCSSDCWRAWAGSECSSDFAAGACDFRAALVSCGTVDSCANGFANGLPSVPAGISSNAAALEPRRARAARRRPNSPPTLPRRRTRSHLAQSRTGLSSIGATSLPCRMRCMPSQKAKAGQQGRRQGLQKWRQQRRFRLYSRMLPLRRSGPPQVRMPQSRRRTARQGQGQR